MDFSNSERALTSLLQRQPPLSPEVHSLSNRLLPIHSDPLNDVPTFLECTLSLLRCGGTTAVGHTHDSPSSSVATQRPRWEPLAVGLHLSLSFLEAYGRRVHGVASNRVFMDGPRLPAVQPQSVEDEEPTTTTTTTTNTNAQSIHDDQHTSQFSNELTTVLSTHLEHSEPRVRTLVAKVSGEHTRLACAYLSSDPSSICGREILARSLDLYRSIGVSLYEHLRVGREAALRLAMEAEERQTKGTTTTGGDGDGAETDADGRDETKDPMEKVSKASGGALDDTTGWRALETNLYGVGSFVCASSHRYFRLAADASSTSGLPLESKTNEEGEDEVGPDPKLIEAVKYCCITHINRHVRAAGINVLEQMIHAYTAVDPSTSSTHARLIIDSESVLHTTIVEVLKVCLADNWSQVRMAASVLCRAFFVALLDHLPNNNNDDDDDSNSVLQKIYVQLLPRMCLNRFYLAQGVKLYSHETWRILFDRRSILQDGSTTSSLSEGSAAAVAGGGGLEAVARCAGAVCRYYVKMCDADNHVVREAACQAVAELANKLGRNDEYKEYLAPFVPLLLQALLMCFHDESWPVRDEACLACGTFCLAYPSECEPELPTLFTRWTEQLTDQIWSVREDAAVALGDAILAYGPTMLEKVLVVVRRDLPSAKDQPAMTMEEYRRRQNDIESHTDSQLYSCGSLAPKLRKGGAGRIGCSNCLINRPKAPWEATDGCIYLIRELCVRLGTGGNGLSCGSSAQYNGETMALTDDVLLPLMEEMIDTCRARHYPQSYDLRTTLWKQLPVMANALGKQRFKRTYLQLFLDLLMKDVDNGGTSQLSAHAAGQCLGELGTLVGDGILRGRLEDEWQERAFDRVVKERGMSRGPAMAEDGFSPFGPSGSMIPSSSMGRTNIGGAIGGKPAFGGGGGTGVRTGAVNHFGIPGTGLVDVL